MAQLSREEAEKYRQIIERAAASLSDSDALEAPMLFPRWEADTDYEAGVRLVYDGVLYTVLQAHTSQTTWTPDVSPSLFARVLIPDPTVIPEWVQPDSTNAYMTGDRVTHNGKTWESLIDNNVWEPGALGTDSLWIEIK